MTRFNYMPTNQSWQFILEYRKLVRSFRTQLLNFERKMLKNCVSLSRRSSSLLQAIRMSSTAASNGKLSGKVAVVTASTEGYYSKPELFRPQFDSGQKNETYDFFCLDSKFISFITYIYIFYFYRLQIINMKCFSYIII